MINKAEFIQTYSNFDKDIIVEIIEIFKDEAPKKVSMLYEDLNLRNFGSLRFNAHSLKGTIGSFCAPTEWNKAKELEMIASNLNQSKGEGFIFEDIKERIDDIKESVQLMIEQLEDIKLEYSV